MVREYILSIEGESLSLFLNHTGDFFPILAFFVSKQIYNAPKKKKKNSPQYFMAFDYKAK